MDRPSTGQDLEDLTTNAFFKLAASVCVEIRIGHVEYGYCAVGSPLWTCMNMWVFYRFLTFSCICVCVVWVTYYVVFGFIDLVYFRLRRSWCKLGDPKFSLLIFHLVSLCTSIVAYIVVHE